MPLDLDHRDLQARSRQIRRDAGVGFSRMAAEAAISKSHLSHLERGIAAPGRRARTWLAILAVLDDDPDGTGHPPRGRA